MTRFWRSGFYRDSPHGHTHWVEGHWVERDDWAKGYSGQERTNYFQNVLSSLNASRSTTSRYITPNAKCPVCGADVFFFQNENGSRVFFDELGTPWPKHPCTDNVSIKDMGPTDFCPLLVRHPIEASKIAIAHKMLNHDQDDGFFRKYGSKFLHPWSIVGKFYKSSHYLLAVENLAERNRKLFSFRRLPKEIGIGTLVFFSDGKMEYFSLSKMEGCSFPVEKRLSKNEFLDRLLSQQWQT